MIKIGPSGGEGRFWDEKGRSGIAQIFISYGDSRIHSLQFQFVQNGTSVLSDKHGRDGYEGDGQTFRAVKLNYPSELITGIRSYSGIRDYVYTGLRYRQQVVTSIIFNTNNATYGPFGCHEEGDIAFDYQIGGHNKFCGFHGTASGYLSSIGVYMEPMTTLSDANNPNEKVNLKNEKV